MIIFVTCLQESPEGGKMMDFRSSLPAYKEKDAILSAISYNQVLQSLRHFALGDYCLELVS